MKEPSNETSSDFENLKYSLKEVSSIFTGIPVLIALPTSVPLRSIFNPSPIYFKDVLLITFPTSNFFPTGS